MKPKIICQTCKKEFYAYSYKNRERKYCSQYCYSQSRIGKSTWNFRNVSTEPSKELSYIAGVMLGDGSFACPRNRDHILQLRVKNKEFTEKFNKIGCSILNKKLYTIREYNSEHYGIFYIVRLHSKKLYELLGRAKYENLQLIMKIVDEYPKYFLEGLFDSDGCVSYSWSGRRLYKTINLSNSSLELLELVKKLLLKFDIKSKIYSHNAKTKKRLAKDGHFIISKKPMYALEIKRKSEIIKFSKIVNFTIKHRAEKLKNLVKELEKINGIDPITNKRKITEYHKQRISKANKGRKRLDMIGDLNPAKRPEARIKISKAKKEYWERIRAEKNAKVGNSRDGATKF